MRARRVAAEHDAVGIDADACGVTSHHRDEVDDLLRLEVDEVLLEDALLLLDELEELHLHLAEQPSPYGDGTSAKRCAAAIRLLLARRSGPGLPRLAGGS